MPCTSQDNKSGCSYGKELCCPKCTENDADQQIKTYSSVDECGCKQRMHTKCPPNDQNRSTTARPPTDGARSAAVAARSHTHGPSRHARVLPTQIPMLHIEIAYINAQPIPARAPPRRRHGGGFELLLHVCLPYDGAPSSELETPDGMRVPQGHGAYGPHACTWACDQASRVPAAAAH